MCLFSQPRHLQPKASADLGEGPAARASRNLGRLPSAARCLVHLPRMEKKIEAMVAEKLNKILNEDVVVEFVVPHIPPHMHLLLQELRRARS